MLRGVLERWVDDLAERQFDAPFLVLLRAHGFYDVHFTHGAYEFGKDFIAKRLEDGVPQQYGFQSKAGDISGTEWNSIHGQIEELVGTWLVHPNYNTSIPRQHRLVTTGSLKGKAILSSKQYKERLAAKGEGNFLVWDREVLLDMLQGKGIDSAPVVLPPPSTIEQLIARSIANELNRRMLANDIEAMKPRGSSIHELREALIHNSLLVSQLLNSGRPFYAVRAAQHGARMALASYLASPTLEFHVEYLEALRFSVRLGLEEARKLALIEPIDLAHKSGGITSFIAAYPLTCFSIIESLGLGALEALWEGERESAHSICGLLSSFVEKNGGCTHPLSDRFAASLVPAVAALFLTGNVDTASAILRGCTKWVCDQMDHGFGIAGPYASAEEEVERIFGAHFDFIHHEVRRESLFAVALADLAFVFAPHLYPEIVHEFKAVDAAPSAVHPLDVPGSAFLNSTASTLAIMNLDYPDSIEESTSLPHMALQTTPRLIEQIGGPLAPLICACLCQDRIFSDTFPRLRQAVHEGVGLKGVRSRDDSPGDGTTEA